MQRNNPSRVDEVRQLIVSIPGLSDREITDRIWGSHAHNQLGNLYCRGLRDKGSITRDVRPDGIIGNFPASTYTDVAILERLSPQHLDRSENWVKSSVASHLERQGWDVNVAWDRDHGCDIEAVKGLRRWCIEAKGSGKHSTMRHNYFQTVVYQALKHHDGDTQCTIALSALPQYKMAWSRLSSTLKYQTGITALFVHDNRKIEEA